MGEDTLNKRKRSIDDSGDREHKKTYIEDSRIGIEDLHLDVGQKYLLCQTRKAPSAYRISPFSSPLPHYPKYTSLPACPYLQGGFRQNWVNKELHRTSNPKVSSCDRGPL